MEVNGRQPRSAETRAIYRDALQKQRRGNKKAEERHHSFFFFCHLPINDTCFEQLAELQDSWASFGYF